MIFLQLSILVDEKMNTFMAIPKHTTYYTFNDFNPNNTFKFILEPIPSKDEIRLNTTNNEVQFIKEHYSEHVVDYTFQLRVSKLLSEVIGINVLKDGHVSALQTIKSDGTKISYLSQMIIAIVVACIAILFILLLVVFIIWKFYHEKEIDTYWVNED